MSCDDRAIGADVVDVAIAIHIVKVGALRACHGDRRCSAHGFEGARGAVDSAEDARFGAFIPDGGL